MGDYGPPMALGGWHYGEEPGGFPGSPLRNLESAFEKEALNASRTAHLESITWFVERAGLEKMCRMSGEEFIRDIYEPTWNWMRGKFNVDVFGTAWLSSFGSRFPDFGGLRSYNRRRLMRFATGQRRWNFGTR